MSEEREIEFYGATFVVVRTLAGQIFVPIRPICDLLGIHWSSQRQRILRDAVLGEEIVTEKVNTPSRRQKMICLPVQFFPMMLSGIDPHRIRIDADLLKRCYRDLYHEVLAVFEEKPLTRQERIRMLKQALASTDDEQEIESIIVELALASGLGIIPRIEVNNPQEEIYLARAADGLCKIGVSAAAKSRIRALNRNRPDKVRLLHSFPADNAPEAERRLHTRYENKQVWGEWFKLGHDDIRIIRGYTAYHSGQFIGKLI